MPGETAKPRGKTKRRRAGGRPSPPAGRSKFCPGTEIFLRRIIFPWKDFGRAGLDSLALFCHRAPASRRPRGSSAGPLGASARRTNKPRGGSRQKKKKRERETDEGIGKASPSTSREWGKKSTPRRLETKDQPNFFSETSYPPKAGGGPLSAETGSPPAYLFPPRGRGSPANRGSAARLNPFAEVRFPGSAARRGQGEERKKKKKE